MKNATASRRSPLSVILETLLFLAVLIALGAMIIGELHAQTPPSAAPDATTVTVSGGVAQAANIAEAVAPNIFTGPVIHTIESIIIIMALISRVLLNYCPGLQTPPPGSTGAKIQAVLNHTGGVITAFAFAAFLSLPLALGGCTAAQVTTFKADANRAAEDVLTAAPKVVAYTATTAADIGIVALDLTKGAAAVVTLTTPPVEPANPTVTVTATVSK